MAVKTQIRLGEILIKQQLITEVQLQEAIKYQKTKGIRLGEALIELGHITDLQLGQALARQLGLPFYSLAKKELVQEADPKLKTIFPERLLRENGILPLRIEKNTLVLALADPLDLVLLDNLRDICGYPIRPVVATKFDLMQAIQTTYTGGGAAGSGLVDLGEGADEGLLEQAGGEQVVKMVDQFLLEAVNTRASDIHVEPQEEKLSIRFRIDGVLFPINPPSPKLMLAIISRIKIMSKMDIAEKRLPQDGGFTAKFGNRTIDFRVSTIPVVSGEKVVIRLLDKGALVTDFTKLGMDGQALTDYEKGITAPFGLIFITGPTGSGKSTTLYATLTKLNSPKKNLLSIEDPVEYKVEGINQVQAKPQIGLTFAAGLKSFLRQDPDIIMVGEVRDLETAEICVRAALTGHLVLSTLHTNDSVSAVTRLVDLGIEPFLLSPSLVLIVAQRLIRRLCPDCKQQQAPPESIAKKIQLPEGTYFEPKGCENCRNTGYRGRIGLYEVFRITPKIREMIGRNAQPEELLEEAKKNGLKTLFDCGLEQAAQGLTSMEEVMGVVLGNL